SYSLFGVHTWAARLVPALAIHACVLLTYYFGKRTLGERAAFAGALSLGLAPGFVSMGRLLVLDGLLALCVSLSLFAALEAVRSPGLGWGWCFPAAVRCALAFLARGPVGVAFLSPPLLAHVWLSRCACAAGWRAWLAFTLVVLAIVLPWFVAVCLRCPEFGGY